MSPLKIAIAGATGNVGVPIVKQLLVAGFHVTVLTRIGSTSAEKLSQDLDAKRTPDVIQVDYESPSSLAAALTGHEVVISTFASAATGSQTSLIDAAISAGVPRFIPSEFGSNTLNPKAATLPVYSNKKKTQAYLQERAMANPGFSYTLFCNGPFLDYGLDVGYIVNPKTHTANIFDGGDRPVSMTTLDTVGKGLVGVINHLEETKNRAVYIQDRLVTQNQLIAIAKGIDGGDWALTHLATEALEQEAYAELRKETPDFRKAMMTFMPRAMYGPGFGSDFSGFLDNDLLGIKELSDEELENLVAKYLKGAKV